jgi:hypothetical protein
VTRPNPNLSEQLLDLDPEQPPARREQHQRRMAELFEQKLTAADRARLALMFVGGLGGATVCGALALTEPDGMPGRTRAALSVLALIGLNWAGLAGVVFRRGAINSAVHGAAAAAMGFAFSLLTTAAIGILALARPGPAASAGLVLLPAVPLVLSSVVLVVHHVRQAELRLRRDVLQTGYRLARRAEGTAGRAE